MKKSAANVTLFVAAVLAAPLLSAQHVNPSTYPVRPVRMVVPLAPGGGSDIVGRIVAQGLTEHWGKPVVVDNRPGAGTAVGTSITAKAPPDGYTVLVSSSSIAISPALYKSLDFDVARDFSAVTLLASQPSMLVVHPSVPAKTLKELLALAASSPGTIPYASAGIGSATHLGTELLMYASKTTLLHVPYKSAGLATSALLSGETQVLLTNMASVMPHASSGRLRVIGISSLKRSPLAPQVPTLAEAGLAGFEYTTWYGMLVPARTPKTAVDQLQSATAGVLRTASTSERLVGQGLQIHGSTALEFDRYLKAEIERWAKVVKSADIRAD